ncbi:hypothetical protein NL532_24040 [Mesorhizobium sp. C120A]|uniref:hypothetical protein n=1 Tax=unclassified Mesorhizobium TaxID=325217 RepID=UPI0003CFEADE|nr:MULTISPECIES: hypothetical protein [unclassified Mesorhizobium]ESZ60645.1 hypothetical protein X728_14995 [Mesorhizobium sp. L103C120A0]WJI43680.1 hypothetical protein NL532_24040 [Mesorhizobium sp. C120A]
MDGINQLDLITQRVLAIHVRSLTEELARAQAEVEQGQVRLEEALARIAKLEAPPTETKDA